jgi:aryl-alcohol dehydrogenase-like predicted oxidoreductase
MKYINLGKTDIKVSRICVGCMSYGAPSEDFHLWTLGQEDTTKMVKTAYDAEVNFRVTY